jgi:hypothetical protein
MYRNGVIVAIDQQDPSRFAYGIRTDRITIERAYIPQACFAEETNWTDRMFGGAISTCPFLPIQPVEKEVKMLNELADELNVELDDENFTVEDLYSGIEAITSIVRMRKRNQPQKKA